MGPLRGIPPRTALPRPLSACLLALGLLTLLPGTGPGTVAAQQPGAGEPVTIGLVVPADGPLRDVGEAARRGAEAAVLRANADGGFHGRPFALRIVAQEGLWGQGLSRVVSLAFDDPVRGVVGGVDGRGAHLIQQVVTKARIPFISPWASDYSLSRGMVPWFFQLVPDDRQQAAAIARDTARRATASPILVVRDTSYDSRSFAAAVEQALSSEGEAWRSVSVTRLLGQDGPASGSPATAGAAVTPPVAPMLRNAAAVVLAVEPTAAPGILTALSRLPRPPTVYAPIRLATGAVRSAAADYPGPVLVPRLEGASVERAGGGEPAAAFAHDAVLALITAIRAAGPNHWRIRDALAATSFSGATGPVAFQDTGRRRGPLAVVPLGDAPGSATGRRAR